MKHTNYIRGYVLLTSSRDVDDVSFGVFAIVKSSERAPLIRCTFSGKNAIIIIIIIITSRRLLVSPTFAPRSSRPLPIFVGFRGRGS